MSDPFGDIPLFRELQRVLAAGDGPVNFEIARQVADAIAQEGGVPNASGSPPNTYADAARGSEQLLGGYTRLQLDEPVLARTISRTEWVASTLESWRWLLEHLSERLSKQVGELTGEPGGAEAMGAVMTQVAPLLLGIQAGTLVGHLARESLGRYDPFIPRNDDGRLFFVDGNVKQVADSYDLDPATLIRWLALQDVARHLVMVGVDWMNRYSRSLFFEVLDSLEIDGSELMRRIDDLQSQGPEALQSGVTVEQVIPIVPTERHQKALGRVRALVAAVEGYARHASTVVSEQVAGETGRVEEGLGRHLAAASPGKSMLASIIGVTFDRSLETSGSTFCAAVVKLKGLPALNQMWAAPDNLPTFDEIKDPFQWMERVLEAE